MAERLFDAEWIAKTIDELAQKVSDRFQDVEDLAVVGIKTRGVDVANRLVEKLAELGKTVELGHLDVTLYRDDIAEGGGRKAISASDLPFELDDKTILLVDDVLGTGRTIRAAMSELIDFGRPARIALLCLIDRGGRELPIQADFVGAAVEVPEDKRLSFHLTETDGIDEVVLED